jgi:hypothetical protein
VKRTLVLVMLLALFAPEMSAAGTRDRDPHPGTRESRFVLRTIVKRIVRTVVGTISTLGDEILTGGKP